MRRASKPPSKPPVPLESTILLAILEWLRFSPVLAWRSNTGGMKNPAGRFVRFGVPGTADILGIVHTGPHRGRFVAIEVKRPGEQRTERQEQWSKMVINAGGISILAHSIDECRAGLETELAKERP